MLTAKRDLDAGKRFFRKMLQEQPLLSSDRAAHARVRDKAAPVVVAMEAVRLRLGM